MILKPEDLTLLSQLIDSSEMVVDELEKALNKKDIARYKLASSELIKFQNKIEEILK